MKRRILLLLLAPFAFGCSLISCDMARNMESPFDRYFVKYIGRDGNQWGVDMAIAPDKSIYVLGNTTSSRNGQQLYIAHATADGNVLWDKVLGGLRDDEACDIELLKNGDIAILGTITNEAKTFRDFSLRRMDKDGKMIDSVRYGRSVYHWDAASFTETDDSYLVTGSTDSVEDATDKANAFSIRFDKGLQINTSWKTTYGSNTDWDVAIKAFEVPSLSLFYVFGYSNRLGTNDGVADYNVMIWVLNSLGDVKNPVVFFNSSMPGTSSSADERLGSVSAIQSGSGPGFLLSGYSAVQAQNQQRLFALKIRRDLEFIDPVVDNVNHEIFQKPPRLDETSDSEISLARSSTFSSQTGGFFLLGAQNKNIYLKKLSDDLTDAWTSPPSFLFGGVGDDLPGAVLESDGRILVLGTIVLGEIDGQSKVVLMKLSPNGKLGE